MARVVCFGELLLRMAAPGRELLLQTPRLDVSVAGAEANVAVALAHLGHATEMVSCVPDGKLGDAVIAYLRGHDVETAAVTRGAGRMGLYFLEQGAGYRASSILYDRDGSSFALAEADAFDWATMLRGADVLHLSGVTSAVGPRSAAAAIRAAQAARTLGVRVSFDGNFRGQLWRRWCDDPGPILKQLVEQADILFGDQRDLALVLGQPFAADDRGRDAAALAAFAAFPHLQRIAATARRADGADSNCLSARLDSLGGMELLPAIEITGIVDRIGSGDAFAAGVLHGMLNGQPDAEALRAGLAMAVLAHSVPGDAAPFRQADLEAFWAGDRDVRR